MRFHQAYDGAYLINLDRRPDRLDHATRQLRRVGIEATRFPALDCRKLGISPEEACSLSHLNVLNLARVRGWQRVLVLEDDVTFADDFNDRISELRLPHNLGWFYLGANSVGEEQVSGELWRSKQTLATHAYIFNLNLYPIFAPLLSRSGAVVDVVYRNYQMSTDTFAYMMRPPLAWQRPDESDVQGGWKDYSDFIR